MSYSIRIPFIYTIRLLYYGIRGSSKTWIPITNIRGKRHLLKIEHYFRSTERITSNHNVLGENVKNETLRKKSFGNKGNRFSKQEVQISDDDTLQVVSTPKKLFTTKRRPLRAGKQKKLVESQTMATVSSF